MELYRENLRNLPVPNHKAYGYQILHVALSSRSSPRGVNYNPRVELVAKGYKFYIGLYSEILRNLLVAKIRTMATNFSPCKGSYVLNQFPSNIMFGMNGFHVTASGAIQGHHGPLVIILGQAIKYSCCLIFCTRCSFFVLVYIVVKDRIWCIFFIFKNVYEVFSLIHLFLSFSNQGLLSPAPPAHS